MMHCMNHGPISKGKVGSFVHPLPYTLRQMTSQSASLFFIYHRPIESESPIVSERKFQRGVNARKTATEEPKQNLTLTTLLASPGPLSTLP